MKAAPVVPAPTPDPSGPPRDGGGVRAVRVTDGYVTVLDLTGGEAPSNHHHRAVPRTPHRFPESSSGPACSTDAAVPAVRLATAVSTVGLEATDHGAVVAPGIGSRGATHLPASFWRKRPELAHISQAARARLVAPDAVLACILARVAALVPHTLEIPAIVGSPMGLTFFGALVGPPSAGKSAASAVAAELLPSAEGVLDRLPIGSGEGMVEILFETVDHDDGSGKVRRVKCQTRHAAIFHIDEGATLAELGSRSGATLLPTMRSAFSHSTLGNTNASAERRRILAGSEYVYGITLGIQPEMAGPLLSDAGAGTPQRFVWLMATDPDVGETPIDWPGCLDWVPPDSVDLDLIEVNRSSGVRHEVGLDAAIVGEVRARRIADVRGHATADSHGAHQGLVRLKVATLLALLDARLQVTCDDWELAGLVVTTSARVRSSIEDHLSVVNRKRENEATERHVRRDKKLDTSRTERALDSATRSIGKVVLRHYRDNQHLDKGGRCSRTCLSQAVAGKHRKLIVVDDAIDQAIRLEWIVAARDGWQPGSSAPT